MEIFGKLQTAIIDICGRECCDFSQVLLYGTDSNDNEHVKIDILRSNMEEIQRKLDDISREWQTIVGE